MSDFERALEFTLWWEKGFVNDPDDPGGRTDKGISEAAHPEVWKDGKVDDAELRQTYAVYWRAVGGDALPWPLSAACFDFAVNSGGWAAALAPVTDLWSPAATTRPSGTPVQWALIVCAIRRAYLVGLARGGPSNRKFSRGWANRIASLEKFCRGEDWK